MLQIKKLSKRYSIRLLIEEFTRENMANYTYADSRVQLDAAAADDVRIKANSEVSGVCCILPPYLPLSCLAMPDHTTPHYTLPNLTSPNVHAIPYHTMPLIT